MYVCSCMCVYVCMYVCMCMCVCWGVMFGRPVMGKRNHKGGTDFAISLTAGSELGKKTVRQQEHAHPSRPHRLVRIPLL